MWTTRNKDLEYIHGLMEGNTRGTGSKENSNINNKINRHGKGKYILLDGTVK